MKLPAFQFYVGDWKKDPGLRGATLAARGLWIEMLCLMFESDRRGFLEVNGVPVTADDLARMAGSSTGEVTELLQELERRGVFSREQQTIFSRRMVRDEETRVSTKKRVKRFRRNASVTLLVTPVKRACTEDEDEDEESGSGSLEESPRETARPPREANPLWDAVCAAFGITKVASTEKARIGRVVKILREKGAQPDDIAVRRNRLITLWGAKSDTIESLAKWWDKFAFDQPADSQPFAAATGRARPPASTAASRGEFASDPGEARRF